MRHSKKSPIPGKNEAVAPSKHPVFALFGGHTLGVRLTRPPSGPPLFEIMLCDDDYWFPIQTAELHTGHLQDLIDILQHAKKHLSHKELCP